MDIRIAAFIFVYMDRSIARISAFPSLKRTQSTKKPGRIRVRKRKKTISVGISEADSEVLEERLRPQHEPLAGDQMEALDMNLLGESLDSQDAHARAHLVIPSMNQ